MGHYFQARSTFCSFCHLKALIMDHGPRSALLSIWFPPLLNPNYSCAGCSQPFLPPLAARDIPDLMVWPAVPPRQVCAGSQSDANSRKQRCPAPALPQLSCHWKETPATPESLYVSTLQESMVDLSTDGSGAKLGKKLHYLPMKLPSKEEVSCVWLAAAKTQPYGWYRSTSYILEKAVLWKSRTGWMAVCVWVVCWSQCGS